jgi:hypothetical protein
MAADELVYEASPPPSGSVVYAAEPMITADASLAMGYFWWEDRESDDESSTGEGWGTARVNIPFGAPSPSRLDAPRRTPAAAPPPFQ